MLSSKRSGAVDQFRIISAFLVIAIHTSPLLSFNDTADFILTRIIARVAVPFFFMATGYFLFSYMEKGNWRKIASFCGKTGIIYGVSIVLYLPLNLYNGYFAQPGLWGRIAGDILFNGTLYHLWYLPAALTGVFLVTILVHKAGIRNAFIVSAALYVLGLAGDSYYGISQQIPLLKRFCDIIFQIFDYTRNGLFFAPVFLTMGGLISKGNKRITARKTATGLIISVILLLSEGLLLHHYGFQQHDSMYIMLLPCMYFLFRTLLQMDGRSSKSLRTVSMLVYILHPWVIVVVRGLAKLTHTQKLFIENSLIHYLAVSIISLGSAMVLNRLRIRFRKPIPPVDHRAWAEIDLAALKHNAAQLQSVLPEQCRLMAVVKANAYGHDDTVVARTLNQCGIQAFAVATLEEGIHLRKNGIIGEILILGYTNSQNINCLVRYRLTQTVLDNAYARALNAGGKKVRVHLKIDTGMHRLGIAYKDLAGIESIFNLKNLIVTGVFSHLCVSDSLTEEAVSFTNTQVKRFHEVIGFLEKKGYSAGKIHIQSSYGVLNYPALSFAYARAGIVLYGVLSRSGKTRIQLDLQPVLAVKARIACVKQITAGESVSYGKEFTAKTDMTIATVTIGYADGIPSNYSEAGAHVLLHSQRAPIIGRICMDQLTIDVSHIDEAKPDDVVTLIGTDGNEQIRCEEVAEKCGIITNELLSRLGCRLNRVPTSMCMDNRD